MFALSFSSLHAPSGVSAQGAPSPSPVVQRLPEPEATALQGFVFFSVAPAGGAQSSGDGSSAGSSSGAGGAGSSGGDPAAGAGSPAVLTPDTACTRPFVACAALDNATTVSTADDGTEVTWVPATVVGLDVNAAARVGVALVLNDAVADLQSLEWLRCRRISDEAGAVSSDLGAHLMRQTLPAAVGSLARLREITMPACNLVGTLPDLSGATSLETLDLGAIHPEGGLERFTYVPTSVNSLDGTFPPMPPGIRHIVLTLNRLSGSLPEAISALTRLETLDVSGMAMSGHIAESIWAMPSLRFLYVGGNSFSGVISPRIAEATNLELAWLDSADFEGELPLAQMFTLPRIRSMLMSNSGRRLTGTIPTSIGDASSLEDMCLTGMPGLTGTLPTQVGSLRNLRIICITETGITGLIPSSMAALSQLNIALMGANQWDEQPLPPFFGLLPRLGWLHLTAGRFVGPVPEEWGTAWPGMTILQIGSNPGVTGELFPHLPDLQRANDAKFEAALALGGPQAQQIRTLGYFLDATGVVFRVLPALELLEVGDTALSGRFPKLHLPNLNGLSIEGAQFSGPADFACDGDGVYLPKLAALAARGNQLEGPLPDCWSQLSDLSHMDVSRNRLGPGAVPASYARLAKLTFFDVSGNPLGSPLRAALSPFTSLPDLAVVDVSNASLTGPLPEDLFIGVVTGSTWTSLAELSLAHNQVVGVLSILIGVIPTLRLLDASHNSLSGPLPYNIANYARFIFFQGNPDLAGTLPDDVVAAQTSIRYPGNVICPELTNPDGTLTLRIDPGYEDFKSCRCEDNHYGTRGACHACPPHATCDGSPHVATAPGYYPLPNASYARVFDRCPNLGGGSGEGAITACNPAASREFECAEGYQGRACTACAEGYGHMSNVVCVPCVDTGFDVFVMLAAVGIVVALVVKSFVMPTNGNGITKSWLFFTQVSGLVATVRPAPGSMGALGDTFSLANFGWSGIECVGFTTYMSRVVTLWLLPPLTVLGFGGAALVHRCGRRAPCLQRLYVDGSKRGAASGSALPSISETSATAHGGSSGTTSSGNGGSVTGVGASGDATSGDAAAARVSVAMVNPLLRGDSIAGFRDGHKSAAAAAAAAAATEADAGRGGAQPRSRSRTGSRSRARTRGYSIVAQVRYRSKDLRAATTFGESCARAGLYTLAITYLPVASVMLHSLSCSPDAAGRRWMDAAPYIACDSDTRATIFALALSSSIVHALGVPLLFGVLLWRWRAFLHTKRMQIVYGWSYGLYRPGQVWHGVAHMCRNLLLTVLLFSFGPRNPLSVALVWLVLQVSLVVHMFRQPYRRALENKLHSAATAVVLTSLSLTVVTEDPDASSATRSTVGGFLLLLNSGMTAAFALAWCQRFPSVAAASRRAYGSVVAAAERVRQEVALAWHGTEGGDDSSEQTDEAGLSKAGSRPGAGPGAGAHIGIRAHGGIAE